MRDFEGFQRGMGLIPTSADTLAQLHREGIVQFSHDAKMKASLTARAAWTEIDCRWTIKEVVDQDSTNMCVGGSGAMAVSAAYAKQGFNVKICPASVYAPICGGRDGGASVGDCLDALSKYGAWPMEYAGIGNFDWKAAYRTKFWQKPESEAALQAAQYRIVEAMYCSTLDDFLAGLQSGMWAGQFCVGAGRSFQTGDDGWLLPYDGTRVNHAQTATGGMKKHPKTGEWGIQGCNSWGTSWGDGGFYWCDTSWLDIDGQELWLVRGVTIPQ